MKLRILLFLTLLFSCDSRNIYFTTQGSGSNEIYNAVNFLIVTNSDTLQKKVESFGVFLAREEDQYFRRFRITGIEYPDSLNRDRTNTVIIEFPISFDFELPLYLNLQSSLNGEESTITYNEKIGEILLDIQTFTRGLITITFFTPYRIEGTFEVENDNMKLMNGSFDLLGVYY